MHDQRSQPGDRQADDFFACDGFAEEQQGKDGNPDHHCAVDDAGFHGGERAEDVIPECEGEGGIGQRQPEDDRQAARVDDRRRLKGESRREQKDRTGAHADDRDEKRVVHLRAVDVPTHHGGYGVGEDAGEGGDHANGLTARDRDRHEVDERSGDC